MTHGFWMGQSAALSLPPWPACSPGSRGRLQLICAGPAGAWKKAWLELYSAWTR